MSQCVPSWDFDENPRLSLRSNSNSTAPDVPMLDYEVAELTWKNGRPALLPLLLPSTTVKPIPSTTSLTKYNTWDKPRASGTLESIVNQANLIPHHHHRNYNSNNHGQKPRSFDGGGGNDMVPWFHHRAAVATATTSATMTRDALFPCSNHTDDQTTTHGGLGTLTHDQDKNVIIKRANKEARVAVPAAAAFAAAPEWSSRDQSVSGSATCGRDSQHVTLDTCERDLGVGFTSTSLCSMENTSPRKPCTKATTTGDDHDSVCHSRPQKRRDKIIQRMKTLQKLVPNSSKILCISNKNKTQKAKSCKVLPLHFPLRRMDMNKFADLHPDGIHLPFFKGVFLISGVLAYDLILLMFAPPFGWFIFTICASVMVLLLYRSRREILQCCQEILEPMWHSTSEAFHSLCDWFRQNFQSIWTAPSQASNGSSMPTPNMKEKHVLGSVNNV
ncbi:hypothetical protein RGQ29_017209 [Quercus rubra]|uniref:Uncharacterized protein n=1 Tax=Quercus rubra TaxID=3512 RepID=A0AAN7J055_QUERU|nr:hypothetical protein RGQ29_017209 [Quercus rubra]